MRGLTLLLLLASPAGAFDGQRAGDILFDTPEALADRLSGQMLEFFDGSKSRYGADGRYGYTYIDGGQVWGGTWRTEQDSQVCVEFDNGSSRCDRLVGAQGRLVLIIADGTRFPIRNREALGK